MPFTTPPVIAGILTRIKSHKKTILIITAVLVCLAVPLSVWAYRYYQRQAMYAASLKSALQHENNRFTLCRNLPSQLLELTFPTSFFLLPDL